MDGEKQLNTESFFRIFKYKWEKNTGHSKSTTINSQQVQVGTASIPTPNIGRPRVCPRNLLFVAGDTADSLQVLLVSILYDFDNIKYWIILKLYTEFNRFLSISNLLRLVITKISQQYYCDLDLSV